MHRPLPQWRAPPPPRPSARAAPQPPPGPRPASSARLAGGGASGAPARSWTQAHAIKSWQRRRGGGGWRLSSEIWELDDEDELNLIMEKSRFRRQVLRVRRRLGKLGSFFKAWARQVAPWVLLAVIYFGCIVGLFAYEQQMCWTDAVYFSVTLLTTVGFGDIVPSTTKAKVMAITAITTGILIGAAVAEFFFNRAIRKAMDSARSKERMRLTLGTVATAEQAAREQRRAFFRQLRTMLVFIVFYMCIAKVVMRSSWLDALYFVVITCTTVGFGDIVPASPVEKVVMAGTMLIGIPLFGNLLGRLIELLQTQRAKRERFVQVEAISKEMYVSLEDFCQQMREIGIYTEDSSDYSSIDRFEFLCYLLVRSEILATSDLHSLMSNFNKLDLTGDGSIDFEDVQEYVRRQESLELASKAKKEEAEAERPKAERPETEEGRGGPTLAQAEPSPVPVAAEPSPCRCMSQAHELRQILLHDLFKVRRRPAHAAHRPNAALPSRYNAPQMRFSQRAGGQRAEGCPADDCGCGRGGRVLERPFDDLG